jgi:hypothetical protein
MRNLLRSFERWVFDEESTILGFLKLIVFVVAPILAVFIFVVGTFLWAIGADESTAMEKCHQKGGAWAVTGQRTVTGGFWSGKVWIPTTTRVTDYGCVKHSGELLP